MKNALLRIEKNLLQWPLVRWPIVGIDRLIRRLLWFWSRLRFGAIVRKRGSGCVCHWNADLKYPQNITLGDGVIIGVNTSIGAHSPVHIGDHVRISRDVMKPVAHGTRLILHAVYGMPPVPYGPKAPLLSRAQLGTSSLDPWINRAYIT